MIYVLYFYTIMHFSFLTNIWWIESLLTELTNWHEYADYILCYILCRFYINWSVYSLFSIIRIYIFTWPFIRLGLKDYTESHDSNMAELSSGASYKYHLSILIQIIACFYNRFTLSFCIITDIPVTMMKTNLLIFPYLICIMSLDLPILLSHYHDLHHMYTNICRGDAFQHNNHTSQYSYLYTCTCKLISCYVIINQKSNATNEHMVTHSTYDYKSYTCNTMYLPLYIWLTLYKCVAQVVTLSIYCIFMLYTEFISVTHSDILFRIT